MQTMTESYEDSILAKRPVVRRNRGTQVLVKLPFHVGSSVTLISDKNDVADIPEDSYLLYVQVDVVKCESSLRFKHSRNGKRKVPVQSGGRVSFEMIVESHRTSRRGTVTVELIHKLNDRSMRKCAEVILSVDFRSEKGPKDELECNLVALDDAEDCQPIIQLATTSKRSGLPVTTKATTSYPKSLFGSSPVEPRKSQRLQPKQTRPKRDFPSQPPPPHLKVEEDPEDDEYEEAEEDQRDEDYSPSFSATSPISSPIPSSPINESLPTTAVSTPNASSPCSPVPAQAMFDLFQNDLLTSHLDPLFSTDALFFHLS